MMALIVSSPLVSISPPRFYIALTVLGLIFAAAARARSSPVSASTEYLMRWPACWLGWLELIFSDSEVAG